MGYTLQASCDWCNRKALLSFGAGMANHLSLCNVPAWDIKNNTVKSVNYYTHKDDINFKFYSDEELRGPLEGYGLQWSSHRLNYENNYCPICRTFSLKFHTIARMD